MTLNFDKKMLERLSRIEGKISLLLHTCCAPCSTTCIERLLEKCEITVFYYNPNIDDPLEYEKRKKEQKRFLEETGWGKWLACPYDREEFEKIANGLENEPERGKRCYLCYELRLKATAKWAKEKGFDAFATTLSVSPYKNAEWLNEIGERVGKEYGVEFLCADFKKQGGYYRSQELSKQYGLYRQDYCGCRFSKAEAEKKRKSNKE